MFSILTGEPTTQRRTAPCARRLLQLQEEALVRRRNAEHDRLERWGCVSRYFSDWDRKASQLDAWASPEYYKQQQRTLEQAQATRVREAQLEVRRGRLRRQLEAERQALYAEREARRRAGVRGVPEERLREATAASAELRRRDEEARRRESELRLYQQWARGQPLLREWERRKQQQYVQRTWVDQVKEQQELRMQREREEMEALRERERQLQEEEEKERQMEEQRRQRTAALQEQLRVQVHLLREKEKLAEVLKTEEADTLRNQSEIEELQQQREKAQNRIRNIQFSLFQQKQYQLRLRQCTHEVLENIEEDLRLLEKVIAAQVKETEEERSRKAVNRLQILRTQQQLQLQKQQEKARLAELEFMFDEEARIMWEKRESQWMAEKQAREVLVSQVLKAVQQQLEEKLQQNLSEQRALLLEREQLLADVEAAHEELKKEQTQQEVLKNNFRLQIDKQIVEKKLNEIECIQKEREAVLQEQQKIKEEEERLLAEMKRLERDAYQQPNYRRKRLLW